MQRRFLICILSLSYGVSALGQTPGPPVVRSFKQYQRQAAARPETRMVALEKVVPGIIYDLKYAGTDNFMHKRMYAKGTATSFLRAPAARALAAVQQELKTLGWGIKVFDAYRPFSVTRAFWELVKDERYVAHPAKGSNHNRGIAVDLTLIDLRTGLALDMGTDFDNFTDTAHHSFRSLPPAVIAHRSLLRSVMEKNGFVALNTEWWHYSFKSEDAFTTLDIPFRKLARR